MSSLSEFPTLQVLEQHEMKWKGRKDDGTVGWFPRSYVKVAQVLVLLLSRSCIMYSLDIRVLLLANDLWCSSLSIPCGSAIVRFSGQDG